MNYWRFKKLLADVTESRIEVEAHLDLEYQAAQKRGPGQHLKQWQATRDFLLQAQREIEPLAVHWQAAEIRRRAGL